MWRPTEFRNRRESGSRLWGAPGCPGRGVNRAVDPTRRPAWYRGTPWDVPRPPGRSSGPAGGPAIWSLARPPVFESFESVQLGMLPAWHRSSMVTRVSSTAGRTNRRGPVPSTSETGPRVCRDQNSPLAVPFRNASHSPLVNSSTGLFSSLESRTATNPGRLLLTSTQPLPSVEKLDLYQFVYWWSDIYAGLSTNPPSTWRRSVR